MSKLSNTLNATSNTILDLIAHGIIIVTKDQKIVTWNRWVADHSGLDSEKVIGRKLGEVLNNLNKRVLASIDAALISGKSTLLSQSFNPHPFPLYRNVSDTKTLMHQKVVIQSKVLGAQGRVCIIEISDYSSNVERELFISHAKTYLDKVIETAQDILVVLNQQFKINSINAVFASILKTAHSAVLYSDFKQFVFDGDEFEKFRALLTARQETIRDLEVTLKATDGTKVLVLLTCAQFKSLEDETMYVITGKDITQEVESKLRLLQSAKMSSLGEMAANIAHEIKNPLAIVSGRVGLLKVGLKKLMELDDKFDKNFEIIENSVNRISKIISGLSALSRNADFDIMEKTSVSQMINQTLALCQERFKYHAIGIVVNLSEDFQLECRPTQICQVLMNLLSNAFDAIEALPEKRIVIDAKKLSNKAIIGIADSGSGIPEQVLDRLMEPFFSTKSSGKGTGLGLSVSKGIIESHGGSFYYDKESKNTRFVLEIPLENAGKAGQKNRGTEK